MNMFIFRGIFIYILQINQEQINVTLILFYKKKYNLKIHLFISQRPYMKARRKMICTVTYTSTVSQQIRIVSEKSKTKGDLGLVSDFSGPVE